VLVLQLRKVFLKLSELVFVLPRIRILLLGRVSDHVISLLNFVVLLDQLSVGFALLLELALRLERALGELPAVFTSLLKLALQILVLALALHCLLLVLKQHVLHLRLLLL